MGKQVARKKGSDKGIPEGQEYFESNKLSQV